ncbi:MAG: DUF5063 domain-containing protein [Mangrovibacterium sp.]
MSEELNSIIYSKQVVEFVTVSNEYCTFIEESGTLRAKKMLLIAQKILPLLYLKTSMLPEVSESEEYTFTESFVTEVDYAYLQGRIRNLLGEHDDYKEVFTEDMQYSEEALAESISESLLDIYQDLKNFIMNYRTADDHVMQEALGECAEHFRHYWGQKLVNVQRPIHELIYTDIDFEQEVRIQSEEENGKSIPNWLAGKYDVSGE